MRRSPASRPSGRRCARRSRPSKPALLPGFDAVLAQVQRAVERRRPADADKAAKNLAVLIRSYEG